VILSGVWVRGGQPGSPAQRCVPVLGVFLTGLAWSAATPERLVAALIVRSATTPVALAWVLRAQQTSTWGPS
jgi:hypothetical protein